MIEGEPTLEDVVLIAARYGISGIAALYRLNGLGLTRRYEGSRRPGFPDVIRRCSSTP
jgi:hypothetical protein